MSFRCINANVPQPPQRRKRPRAKSEEDLVRFWKMTAAGVFFFSFFLSPAPHGCTPVISSCAGSKAATGVRREKEQGVGIRREKRRHGNDFSRGTRFRARGRNAGAAAEGLSFSETMTLVLASPGPFLLLLGRIYCQEAGLTH